MTDASTKAAPAAADAPSAVGGEAPAGAAQKKKKMERTVAAVAEPAEKKTEPAAAAAAVPVSQKRRILRYTSVAAEANATAVRGGPRAGEGSLRGRDGEETQQPVGERRDVRMEDSKKKKKRKGDREEVERAKYPAAIGPNALENVRELETFLFGKSSSGTELLQHTLPQRKHRQHQSPQQLQPPLLKQQQHTKQQQPARTSSTSGGGARRRAAAAGAAAAVGASEGRAGGTTSTSAAATGNDAAAAEVKQQQGAGSSRNRDGLRKNERQRGETAKKKKEEEQQQQRRRKDAPGQRQQQICRAEGGRAVGHLPQHELDSSEDMWRQQLESEVEADEEQHEDAEQQQGDEEQNGPSLMRVAIPAGDRRCRSQASTYCSDAAQGTAAAAEKEEAAWVDPDDASVRVDVAGEAKLRKLRRREGETTLGGVEYTKRLRQLHGKLVASRSSSWIERARMRKQQHQQQQQQLLLSAHAADNNASSGDEEEGDETAWVTASSTGQPWAAIRSSSAVLSAAAVSKQQQRMQLPAGSTSSSSGARAVMVGCVVEKEALPAGKISVRRLVDANAQEYSGRGVTAADFRGSAQGRRGSVFLLLAVLQQQAQQLPTHSSREMLGLDSCAVSAVDFHPQQPTLLTAGRDKTLRLFAIDGEENAKLEAIHFRNFPLLQAKFASADGNHVLAVSHASPSLAHYDLITGEVHMLPASAVQAGQKLAPCGFHFLQVDKEAAGKRINSFALASAASQNVLLCDGRSKRLLRVLAMNGKAAGIAYHPTKEAIFTADREANIYEWDLRAEGCVSVFQDSSCLRLSALAASPAAPAGSSAPPHFLPQDVNNFSLRIDVFLDDVAAARAFRLLREFLFFLQNDKCSRTGFVDLFALSSAASSEALTRKPVKELGNLTTEITTVAFHPSNQLLCIASKWKKDALRLVHLPTMTVFQNWPVERTPLRYVTAAAFSHQRGFMAIGNDRGRVLLYRVNHFGG